MAASRSIEARLVISGEDKGASSAIEKVIAAVRKMDEAAKVSAKMEGLARGLQQVEQASKAVDAAMKARTGAASAEAGLKATRDAAAAAAKALTDAKAARVAFDGVKAAAGSEQARQIEATTKAVRDASAAYRKAESDVRRANAAVAAQTAGMASAEAAAARFGADLGNLVGHQQRMRTATESATNALRSQARAEDQASRAAAASARRREAATALASGAGIYAGHKVSAGTAATLHTYREFDKYSRQTEAFGNFSKEEMAKIIAMSIHGDKDTRFNDIQYLQGAKALGGRGVKASSVMGILPQAGYYGQAMGTDLPEAVAGLEGSLFGFQRDLSTPEKATAAARRTADLQVNAAKAFGLTHHDLKGIYEYGALGANMTGLSEEKLLAFGGLGKKLNIEGSAQGNAWRAMTSKFLSPTRKGREALAGVGINYSEFQQMPERLSVDNFSDMIAQQYGARLDKGARAKLEKAFTNKDVFGDASTFAVAVKDAVKGQVGVKDARSANKVLGSAERFRQNNVEKVDVNALFDALLAKVGGGNLALANAIFGEKQGTRIMAALRDKDVWAKSVEKMEHTPEGKAKDVSGKMSGGFEGAMSRWEKSLMNLETAFGRSWDKGGEGGFLTGVVDQSAKLVLALADMDAKVLQVASGLAWLGGKVVEGAGTLGLIGSALALTKSATALDAAAIKLAGGGVVDTAKTAGPAAAGAAFGLGGIIVAGGAVAGAVASEAGAVNAQGAIKAITGAETDGDRLARENHDMLERQKTLKGQAEELTQRLETERGVYGRMKAARGEGSDNSGPLAKSGERIAKWEEELIALDAKIKALGTTPMPPPRPDLFKPITDKAAEAGTQAGQSIADGVKAKEPEVVQQGTTLYEKLKGVFANGIMIPLQMSLDGSGTGGGPGIQNASFDGGGGLSGMIRKASLGGGGDVGNGIGTGGGGGIIHRGGSGPGSGIGSGSGSVGAGLGHAGSGGAGGSGKSSPMPGIPASVEMSDAERNTLGLIQKYESHGGNTLNYVGRRQGISPLAAKGYTAQGYYQILNSNWRRLAPKLGITAPNAMAGSLEEQTKVALALLRGAGGRPKDWAPFNPALRGALARGERAPSGVLATKDAAALDPKLVRGLDGKEGLDLGNGTMKMPTGEIRSITKSGLEIPDAPAGGFGGGGRGGIGNHIEEFGKHVDRLQDMAFHGQIELVGTGNTGVRARGMKMRSRGPLTADLGVSMPGAKESDDDWL